MSIKCPKCGSINTMVTCTRGLKESVKRYRKCLNCNKNFCTLETYRVDKEDDK